MRATGLPTDQAIGRRCIRRPASPAAARAPRAAAVENARELAAYCQSLERGAKGAGRHIYIPRTWEALTCWGYMRAMQDLSVLADEEEHRIMGACPPEQTTTLQLIQSFLRYARAHRTELQGNAVVAIPASTIPFEPAPSTCRTTMSRTGNCYGTPPVERGGGSACYAH